MKPRGAGRVSVSVRRGSGTSRSGVAGGPAVGLAACALALAACSPRVGLEAPREPIVINLNVKIDHEIRVKVDRELEELFQEEEDIF